MPVPCCEDGGVLHIIAVAFTWQFSQATASRMACERERVRKLPRKQTTNVALSPPLSTGCNRHAGKTTTGSIAPRTF